MDVEFVHQRMSNTILKVFVGVFVLTIFMFVYGSITHAFRNHDVVAYHRFWPTDNNDIPLSQNPNHHPNHCWSYFVHVDPDSYYPNPLNTTYPPRNRMNGYDMMPYATSTSFVYVGVAVGVVILAGYLENAPLIDDVLVRDNVYIPTRVDVGGIVLSLAWVAASSAEFHRTPSEVTRHSDWAMIGPLLSWIGADAFGIEQWVGSVWGFFFKLTCVFTTIYASFAIPKQSIFFGLALLVLGYGIAFHLRKALSGPNASYYPRRTYRGGYFVWGDLTRFDLLNIGAIILSGYTAAAFKSYGNEPYSYGPFSTLFPVHNFHHLAECTNDVNAARLEDLTHGWWHVCSAYSLWFIILTVFGIPPLANNTFLYGIYYTIITILIIVVWTLHENTHGTYAGWLATTYTTLLMFTCVVCFVIYRQSHSVHTKEILDRFIQPRTWTYTHVFNEMFTIE